MEGPHAGGIGPVNENGADSMGQISQNRAVLRLKVRPPPGMSAWAPFESSQETNDLRAFASPSCLCDADLSLIHISEPTRRS